MVRKLGATAWVVAVFVVGGCVEPRLVPCGDLLCPEASVCVAGQCASAAQIEACDGVADGDLCTVSGGVGKCTGGVCVASGCGNLIVEAEEVCDDGNGESGDGCRGDCLKVEVCNDRERDVGEACDDGNTNAVDGCDACMATRWEASSIVGGNLSATSAGLAGPTAVALDRQGNLFVVELGSHRIRRIDRTGVITTVAGTGVAGFSGDGGPAVTAQLSFPSGIAVDGLGNVFIADRRNARIRRVDPDGIMTTIAGSSVSGFGGDGGPATSALLTSPAGVAVDGLGNVFIADPSSARVRRVDTLGKITTIAGNGTPGFGGDGGLATSALLTPNSVAVDGAGNTFIADDTNERVRRIDAAGVITTVAGGAAGAFGGDGGPATSAALNEPTGIAVDTVGQLFIADRLNRRIRRVDSSGIITTIAGTGSGGFVGDGGQATAATLDMPHAAVVDGLGNVLIADYNNNRIRRVDTAGVITTIGGTGTYGASGDGGFATSATLAYPSALAFDAASNLLIADMDHNLIHRVDPAGVITTVAGTGGDGFAGDGGPALAATLTGPEGVAVDALGQLFIADTDSCRVRRVDTANIITTIAGTGGVGSTGDGGPAVGAQLQHPGGMVVDSLGNLYIASISAHRVRRIDPSGVITTVAGTGAVGSGGDGGLATNAQLNNPTDLAIDALGRLLIADSRNHRIRRVDSTGLITTVAGTGTFGFGGDGGPATSAQLNAPSGIAVDDVGNLLVADLANHRVRQIGPTGIISTVAGTGTRGASGDGGPATNAQLAFPDDVAIDSLGRLLIGDFSNDRIRRVDSSGVMSTVAGSIDPEGMGPLARAHLADPRALVVDASFMLVAGGSTGTVQAIRSAEVEVIAGRYPQPVATANLARFRDQLFGAVAGIAYDAADGRIFVSETSANRIHVVSIVDPSDERTWTIAVLANAAGTAGFADGSTSTAKLREPEGLYYDAPTKQLYVADTGNHVVRVIDLASGVVTATITTIIGMPQIRGAFGDDGPATSALLFAPGAITRCGNGDVFVADTGNHRIRRVTSTGTITTVLGDGVAASSGEGVPAANFPVDTPRGLACDAAGNLFVTSSTTVRLLPADASGAVDGSGRVQTIYGAAPRVQFPASVTSCLTGLAVVDATRVRVLDSCTGLVVELQRIPVP